jgi:hypothetical protein
VDAIEALAGQRAPVVLRMTRYSVEGTAIVFVLSVKAGEATLRIDERADGGGIRNYVLSSLQLVQYIPSRWVNNTEVEKERFAPVSASTALGQPGVYLLVAPKCLTSPCAEVF